jgi:hypothetical protein
MTASEVFEHVSRISRALDAFQIPTDGVSVTVDIETWGNVTRHLSAYGAPVTPDIQTVMILGIPLLVGDA